MKRHIKFFTILIVSYFELLIGCRIKGTPEDLREIIVGNQVWMAKNLDMDKFRNGDFIYHAKNKMDWIRCGKNGEPAWCYYIDNSLELGDRYGKLYNWYAVDDPRGLAPAGWHVASDAEWIELCDYLEGDKICGKKLKSIKYWSNNEKQSGGGSNEVGFNGFPGGLRSPIGSFEHTGYYGSWWTSSQVDSTFAISRYMNNRSDLLSSSVDHKSSGFSVRCLKD